MNDLTQPGSALIARLRALTPARVGLERTGVSLCTSDQLDFQRAHAQARDAVHACMDVATLASSFTSFLSVPILRLHSAAPNRNTYLQRPDLGRQLDGPSLAQLSPGPYDLALVVADGLSALAVERHAAPLVATLLPLLDSWRIAPLAIVEQGRVAVADQIGAALGATISIMLIGERPGLSSADSLGAYITFGPKPGRTDAERNCISNIRAEGLSYTQAATQLAYYLSEARRLRLSGIQLKDNSRALGEV